METAQLQQALDANPEGVWVRTYSGLLFYVTGKKDENTFLKKSMPCASRISEIDINLIKEFRHEND